MQQKLPAVELQQIIEDSDTVAVDVLTAVVDGAEGHPSRLCCTTKGSRQTNWIGKYQQIRCDRQAKSAALQIAPLTAF